MGDKNEPDPGGTKNRPIAPKPTNSIITQQSNGGLAPRPPQQTSSNITNIPVNLPGVVSHSRDGFPIYFAPTALRNPTPVIPPATQLRLVLPGTSDDYLPSLQIPPSLAVDSIPLQPQTPTTPSSKKNNQQARTAQVTPQSQPQPQQLRELRIKGLEPPPNQQAQTPASTSVVLQPPVIVNPSLYVPRPQRPLSSTIIRPSFLDRAQAILARNPNPLAGVSRQALIDAMKNVMKNPIGPASTSDGVAPSKKPKLSLTETIAKNGPIWHQKDDETEYTCPICLEIFTEPHFSTCGHTYCLKCILSLLPGKSRCPRCDTNIKRENIFPNRTLYDIIKKKKEKESNTEIITAAVTQNVDPLQELDIHSFLRKKYSDLKMSEVDVLIGMLIRKKKILQAESEEIRHSLILEFLTELNKRKESELEDLRLELGFIQTDLAIASSQMDEFKLKSIENGNEELSSNSLSPQPTSIHSDIETMADIFKRPASPIVDIAFNKTNKDFNEYLPSIAQRKLKVHGHLDELAKTYLQGRRDQARNGDDFEDYCDFSKLKETLVAISRYRSFKVLATLTYTSDVLLNANIVSTIEFDKDREFFGIAGVTKKIKLFEYESVIASAVNMQCPNGEILCPSKISCISYNHFYKNKLASSDYDGKITVWDANTCSQFSGLNEHEKRVWSVDFSEQTPKLLISGSDDCKVKLWSIHDKNSTYTLHTGANVCCVKFVPGSSYEFGFGSADHSVHVYDIRSTNEPLRVYEGHKKAVSYVKFASKTQLISASTDSQLKLWDIRRPSVQRSYTGHVNDKNFVGLTTDGNYLACGSENNSVYVYYKEIPSPILNFQFENYRSMIHPVRQEDVSCEFVSAVAWRPGSPIIVAANSQGIVKVLELI